MFSSYVKYNSRSTYQCIHTVAVVSLSCIVTIPVSSVFLSANIRYGVPISSCLHGMSPDDQILVITSTEYKYTYCVIRCSYEPVPQLMVEIPAHLNSSASLWQYYIVWQKLMRKVCMRVRVCACVCERERKRERGKREHVYRHRWRELTRHTLHSLSLVSSIGKTATLKGARQMCNFNT